MDARTTEAVIKCLEIDCDFYRELTLFLMKKHTKILEDDLDWLTASLNDEQAYVMKSQNLENKRLQLFKGLGIEDKKLKELIEEAPEDYKGKLKRLSVQLTELIDGIREMNEKTNELVKRKLDNQQDFVKRAGIFQKPETYDRNLNRIHFVPFDKTGLDAGSTATTFMLEFIFLRYLPTPLIVPPVPTPETTISTFPSVCSHISGPVVSS